MFLERKLKISLPPGQSAFLLGPRQTGKSTYLKHTFPESTRYDLLEQDLSLRLLKAPHLLREELLAQKAAQTLRMPIIIDEIQKVPALLNEVHGLIENHQLSFILCGSSARKLRQGGVNLLGGRAWRYSLHPLSFSECPDLDLLTVFARGLIPAHYLNPHYPAALSAYVQDYLKQEIQQEGLVRNLSGFAHFLDSVAFSNAEAVNYTRIATDCGISAKTVKEYYQILEDTLIGSFVSPFHPRPGRDSLSEQKKFYLFDVGVAHWLSQTTIEALRGPEAGKAFEHFIFMELSAYIHYTQSLDPILYWRHKNGWEVDFILKKGQVAIECKISPCVHKQDMRGLNAFIEQHSPQKAIVVSQDPALRLVQDEEGKKEIWIMPWRLFLSELWAGKIL